MTEERRADFERPPFDGSLDDYPELLNGWFQAECAELWRGKLAPEDSGLREKAMNLLRFGAMKTLQGHPPPDFIRYMAACILSHVDGKQPSLDHAFRLTAAKGRTSIPPSKEMEVVESFTGAMYGSHGGKLRKKERIAAALAEAFKVHHGWKPAAHEVVGDRMRATRKILQRYGNL
jgi:hypothetical protein